MTDSQNSKCHVIIHGASAAAAAAASGMAQLPGSDNAVIVPIQITMIISLGGVFGRTITKSAASALLSSAAATVAGRAVSQFLVGWIPFLGNAVNATTAAGITETIGWSIANNFAEEYEKEQNQNIKKESATTSVVDFDEWEKEFNDHSIPAETRIKEVRKLEAEFLKKLENIREMTDDPNEICDIDRQVKNIKERAEWIIHQICCE